MELFFILTIVFFILALTSSIYIIYLYKEKIFLKKFLEVEKQRNEAERDTLIKTLKEEQLEEARELAKHSRDEVIEKYNYEIKVTGEKIIKLQEELNDYKEKRKAINEDILRARKWVEQKDFYRVQIDPQSKNDLLILESIKPRILKIDFLNKIIYSNYIDKSVKEMTKRVLEGKNPSGVYKVTNIITKEIYIGKSVTIATRWANHIKSAFGLDGAADSMFQRALKKYGVENFTWEVLELVPKEKLTEREKYYISFYDTKKYGYNERLG